MIYRNTTPYCFDIRCLFLLDSASATDLSGCDCPPRCTNVVHEATVSSSRLSDMTIKYYLSQGNNKSEIGRRYVNAVETRNRIASSLLTDVLGHLEKLRTMYQRLRADLDVDFIEPTTSLPGQIRASINTIVQITQDSVEEFSSQIVNKFTKCYEENIDFIVTQILRSAKILLSDHFYFTSVDANDTDTFNANLMEKLFDYKDAFCKYFKAVNTSFFKSGDFSVSTFIDRTCHDQDLYYCYIYEIETSMRNYTGDIEGLVELYKTIAKSARKVLECMPMYRTFLNEVQSWLKKALTIHSSLPLHSANRRYVLTELDNELNWLKDVSHTFAQKTVVRSLYLER